MRTAIERFCRRLTALLEPFARTLDHAIPELETSASELGLTDLLQGLEQNREELARLREQISGEESYLLIFGPLKSGKSTLMNAISGSYGSEVSSLPAYPCLVYVRHAASPHYRLTRFDGTTADYPDNPSLQETVRSAHGDLAEAVRRAEEADRTFEPTTDHPAALQRVDIGLPTTELEQAATVLVDTPGLLAKMRFGYDRMTRDFRDRAACALFVVRADNLFLDAVFEEFGELLAQFSRIFLVVNVDHSKQDLEPDGRLRPSLESSDPSRIVDTFRSLAMSASVREAFAEGRLQVYPIDLLQAARSVLATSGEAPPEPEPFRRLVGDLEDYLNGSDYVREFREDTLRRAHRLEQGLETHLGSGGDDAFRRIREAIDGRKQKAEEHLAAVDQLRAIDWNRAFARPMEEHERLLQADAERFLRRLHQQAAEALASWWETGESLAQLERDRLAPLLRAEVGAMEKESRQRMRLLLSAPNAGAHFTPEEVGALLSLGIDLNDHLPEPDAEERAGGSRGEIPVPELPVDEIPVRRQWWDYLLFRSATGVRRRVLGPPDRRDKPVSPRVKERRLGTEARSFLADHLKDQVLAPLVEEPRRSGQEYLRAFAAAYQSTLEERVRAQREKAIAELEEGRLADRRFRLVEQARESLRESFDHLRTGLRQLAGGASPAKE
jgi:GTPase SAR1 family protein